MDDVRLKAAEMLLNRGVRFRLPASFVSRLLRRDRIDIHPLFPGTILEFSRVVIQAGLEDAILKKDFAFLEKAIEPVTRCIAICVLNDEDKIRTQTEELTRKYLWEVPTRKLVEMFLVISELNHASDFIDITIFLSHQMTMMMNVKNLGQEANGR